MSTRLTRRATLAGGLLTGLAAASAAPARAASGSPLTARPAPAASAFVDSVGLQVHVSYTDTPYTDVAAVRRALQDLGVRHVRDDLRLDRPDQWAALNHLAAGGIGVDVITGQPGEAPPAAYVDVAARRLAGLEALEGTNEWDQRGGAGWAREAWVRQVALHAAARAHPRTAAMPVLGPAPVFHDRLADLAAVGALREVADVVNVHAYGNGRPLGELLPAVAASVARHQPGQPVAITETGYHNAVNSLDPHRPVSEAAAAGLTAVSLLQAFGAGVARTYLYELVDEFPDPAKVDPEACFGLLRRDWRPKPAYLALRTLLRLAEGTAPAQPAPLVCGLEGPADLQHQVLQKGDGSWLLALWRSEPPGSGGLLGGFGGFGGLLGGGGSAPRTQALVTLEDRVPLRVYPLLGGARPSTDTTASRVAVDVGAVPVVVAVGGRRDTDLRRPL